MSARRTLRAERALDAAGALLHREILVRLPDHEGRPLAAGQRAARGAPTPAHGVPAPSLHNINGAHTWWDGHLQMTH